MVDLNPVLKGGRAFYLAYDQGLEHGPEEFNDDNVDPLFIIELARKGEYNGLIVQKGIAEKYNKEIKASKVPLIVKLNGKTNLVKGEPVSPLLCTVKEAISLGAKAVGFTIYIGSVHESSMMNDFEKVLRESHSKGLPVIAWVYPRGKSIEGRSERELLAYSARVGLEIGADLIKIKHDGNADDLEWAVKSAGRTKVVVAGGSKVDESDFVSNVDMVMKSGAIGVAVGRNIWKSKNPFALSKKIRKIVFNKKLVFNN